MKQSRLMSLVESIANVAVGYGVAVVTQILIFPAFGLHTTLAQNLKMGAVFTVVSIVRSYVLRRVFEAIRVRDFQIKLDLLTSGRPVTNINHSDNPEYYRVESAKSNPSDSSRSTNP